MSALHEVNRINMEMDSKIFAFIYAAAMRDATLQLSYRGEKAWLTDCDRFPASTIKLKEFVSDVIFNRFQNQVDFDERFVTVAKTLCDEINIQAKNDEFTFGNAQKLINIMMKFFYLHTYGNNVAKKAFRFCHCPMDQQLLDSVWKNRNKLSTSAHKDLGRGADFRISWGNEQFTLNCGEADYPPRYKAFQSAIKEFADSKNVFPIEYDFFIWNTSK